MTYGLLEADTTTVLVGDGHWENTYEIDALACGRFIRAVDICSPNDVPDYPNRNAHGFKVVPFAVIGEQIDGVRCTPTEAESEMTKVMGAASEVIVARNFWSGDIEDWRGVDEGMFLMDADIDTVAAGATVSESAGHALEAAYAKHPEITPILHLGIGSAISFVQNYFIESSPVEIVVSPGYPHDAIAVTGPVVVHLGSVETIRSIDPKTNTSYLSGTRLASVEFDPCLAVRVA